MIKYMKDQGILKKDPEEAFFAKKFKGTCNKFGKQGHKGADCWSKKGKEGVGREALGTDKSMCFKCKKVGHLSKDCPKVKDKKEKDGGMFLGMMERLEVKQEEAEMDDHFTASFDCSVFLESNEGQAEFCAGTAG